MARFRERLRQPHAQRVSLVDDHGVCTSSARNLDEVSTRSILPLVPIEFFLIGKSAVIVRDSRSGWDGCGVAQGCSGVWSVGWEKLISVVVKEMEESRVGSPGKQQVDF